MTKFPKLLAFSAIAISVIILLSTYVYVEYQKSKTQPAKIFPEKQSQPVSPELAAVINGGRSPEPDKQAFENFIAELLQVSPADEIGGLGERRKIDMPARDKYFSAQALSDYKSYIEKQKSEVNELGVDSGAAYTCGVNYDYKSQKYDVQGAKTEFHAMGKFSCGAWDSFDQYGKFKINILAEGNIADRNTIKITKWNVEILEHLFVHRSPGSLEINGKKYTVVNLSYTRFLKAIELFQAAMTKRQRPEKLTRCSYIIDLPVRTAQGNHSYGGKCTLEYEGKFQEVIICHDIMLGRLHIEPYKQVGRSMNSVAETTANNCYGG